MATQSSQTVLINGFGVLFVILNSFGLGLRLSVGKLLAQAFAHWKIAVCAVVINLVIIPLVFIGYLLTVASSIPGEIKVGFCVAALSAGMPFAPLLARLAKADASIATTLLVVLTAATIIALPIGLPLAIDAVDAHLKTSVWDVAWPLLLFLLLPAVLGCCFRLWWPDLTPPLAPWVVRVAILCLLFNLNFSLVAYWSLFKQTWGTESYVAAIAGPFIGLGCGYLLVSGLRVKDATSPACDRGNYRGAQHRSDAPDDDLPLRRRPTGHGLDHHSQHRRHRGRGPVRADVEARCLTVEHSRHNAASQGRAVGAYTDVTSPSPDQPCPPPTRDRREQPSRDRAQKHTGPPDPILSTARLLDTDLCPFPPSALELPGVVDLARGRPYSSGTGHRRGCLVRPWSVAGPWEGGKRGQAGSVIDKRLRRSEALSVLGRARSTPP